MEAAVMTPARDIETVTAEILTLKKTAGESILELGRRLIEAKELLPCGAWLPWLEERAEFSERAAQRLMRLAREWSNPTALSDLGATKALALLALPPEEREEFMAETHQVDGEAKTVIDMSARELQAALRARAEAEAARTSAEEARAQMERDMQAANALLAGARRENEAAAEREASLRAELEALKSRPIEVVGAAVPDESALEAAREKGAEAVRKKLEQARAEAEAAKARLRQAEDRAAGLEKRLQAAGSPEIAAFGAYFEQAKEAFNRMTGLLLKLGNAGAPEAGKLANALRALLEAMGRQLPDERGGNAE